MGYVRRSGLCGHGPGVLLAFTGIAAMEIFGSRIGRERSLTGEAVNVTLLNTLVAILAGLIIFPVCFAYNVTPDSGPSLSVRHASCGVRSDAARQHLGRTVLRVHELRGASTVIAVFENPISFTMDKWDVSIASAPWRSTPCWWLF
ncbi:MAG: hypothetical protein ACLTQI_03260 [Slackia sp.]